MCFEASLVRGGATLVSDEATFVRDETSKIKFDTRPSTKPYFQEAVWIVRKLGLEHLMTLQQNYDITLVHQFFATVQFGEDVDVKLTDRKSVV